MASEPSEDHLIENIRRRIPSSPNALLRVGIGDDAAILRPTPGTEWVLTCDQFVEGIHFTAKAHLPDVVGYKALARATSDIAAMGARPRIFLLSLALPAWRTGKWLDEMTRGMARAAQRFGLTLAGGDTARITGGVAISITVLGEVRHGHAVRRSGARAGDAIFVSGELGAAQLGLEQVMSRTIRKAVRNQEWKRPMARHNYPEPCLALGQWLAERGLVSAMMDLSDGLSTDLARLCKASHVGARIHESALPGVEIPSALRKLRSNHALHAKQFDARRLALHGGEDYGLLFTVPRKRAAMIPRRFHGTRLTRIGEIVRDSKIMLVSAEGAESALVAQGWDHFSSVDTTIRRDTKIKRRNAKS